MNDEVIKFHFANPLMSAKDVKKTVKFYEELLGFDIDVLWENANYGCVSQGGITIEFGEGRPDNVSGSCLFYPG